MKSKLYLILSILTVIVILSSAAICNGCNLLSSTSKTDEEKNDEISTNETNNEVDKSDKDNDQSNISEKSKPTITLEIYEGPVYSDADSVCYYKIEAKVTGNPKPDVAFSRDDSVGALGDYKVQINLKDPKDTYTLKATAKNSEGEDSASLDLTWGCNVVEPKPEPKPEPEPEVAEEEITIPADASKSGYVSDSDHSLTGWVSLGDNYLNKRIKGLLTFSLSNFTDMKEISVIEVKITIPGVRIYEKPWEAGSQIIIRDTYVFDPFKDSLMSSGGNLVKTFVASDNISNLDFSTPELKHALQTVILQNDKFQLIFELNNVGSDWSDDYYYFNAEDAKMYVKYMQVKPNIL